MRNKWIASGVLLVAAFGTSAVIHAQDVGTTTSTRAWLGVSVVEQNDQVVVARVQPGSPAADAALLIGDAIVAFNDAAIESVGDLTAQVQAAAAGSTVELDLLRAGEAVSVDVVLGTAPMRGGRGAGAVDFAADPLRAAERLVKADLEAADTGYSVVAVNTANNPFGLTVGDVITTINGQAAADVDWAALHDSLITSADQTVTLEVTRAGETISLSADAPTRGPGSGGRRGGPGMGEGRPGRGDRAPGMGGRPGSGAPVQPITPPAASDNV